MSRAQNKFWKISKIFLAFKMQILSSTYVAWGRKRGSIWETFEETQTSIVFRLFPRLRTQATYFEHVEFAS